MLVVLNNMSGTVFHITKVEADVGTAQVKPLKDRNGYEVHLTLPPILPTGILKSEIRVHTTHPKGFISNFKYPSLRDYPGDKQMKRTYILFGMTLLFSSFILTVNTWGAPYISFTSNRTGQTDIYIVDTNGKNLRNLTNHPAQDWGATWAPDGRSFAFASNRDGNSEIYIKTFNEAEARRLTNDPEDDFDPVWSAFSPAWSPDGNWIAFVSPRNVLYDIYKIDINGENLQRLTNQGHFTFDITWSPDGQSIAFGSIGRLYVMDADGKNLREIKNPGAPFPRVPAWSPDGKQIACVSANDGDGIYIMDTDGQNARRISPFGTWSFNPAWSPDGKWIAYDAYDAGVDPVGTPNAWEHIFIVSVEGGEPRQITQHPGQHESPAWVRESFFSVSPTVDTQTTLWGRLKQAKRMTQ